MKEKTSVACILLQSFQKPQPFIPWEFCRHKELQKKQWNLELVKPLCNHELHCTKKITQSGNHTSKGTHIQIQTNLNLWDKLYLNYTYTSVWIPQ